MNQSASTSRETTPESEDEEEEEDDDDEEEEDDAFAEEDEIGMESRGSPKSPKDRFFRAAPRNPVELQQSYGALFSEISNGSSSNKVKKREKSFFLLVDMQLEMG